MTKMLTPKEIAQNWDTDGRSVRKFLRSITPKDEQPGKGARWAVEAKSLRSLKKEFDAWVARKAEAAQKEDNPLEEEVEDIETEMLEAPEGDDEVEDLV